LDPEVVFIGISTTFTLINPVYNPLRDENLTDCPSITTVGNVLDASENITPSEDFTVSLTGNILSIQTT
jgi:hypothetical protein